MIWGQKYSYLQLSGLFSVKYDQPVCIRPQGNLIALTIYLFWVDLSEMPSSPLTRKVM